MKKNLILFAAVSGVLSAGAFEPILPYRRVKGEPERMAADIRHIRQETGLRRFFITGPGFNEVMYAPFGDDVYPNIGRDIAAVKKLLKGTDIEIGWWCAPSIRYMSDFPSIEDAWGNTSKDNKKCVLDPAFQDDWAGKVKSVVALGGVKFVNIEDDFTYSWGRGLKGGACFCRRHLDLFAKAYGKRLTGPEIAEAFQNRTAENLPIREAFARTTRESLCAIARKVRAAVDEIDPSVRIMLCESGSCSDRDGDAVEALARAFAGPGTRPAIRPSGAIYGAQTTPADIPGAVSHTFFTLERTPKDVEMFYEADPYPHNRFYTSASQMLSLMSGAIFAGSHSILFYCLQYLDDPLEDPGYAQAYVAAKPRLEAVQDFIDSRRAKLGGIRAYWRAEDFSLTHGIGYGHCRQLADEAFLLAKFGLPYTTRKDAKGPAILAGGVVETMPDEEIRAILSRGVLVDAPAADGLKRRGFGDLLGADVELAEGRLPVIGENILPAAKLTRKGRTVNAFYIFNAGTEGTVEKFATLKPRPGTEVWSEFTGVGGKLVTPSLTLARNALGGRVAVMATSILGNRASGLYNLRKQELMRNLMLRLDPEALPVSAVDAPGIWTLANVSEDGQEMLVMVNNLSGDVRDRQVLAFEGKWAKAKVSRLGEAGRPVALGETASRWTVPFALGQMMPEFLIVSCRDAGRGADVKIAADGRALADIVIAEKASVAAQFGALDLQWHLKKMTGADFRIIRDTEPQTRYEIRVGESSRTKHRADEFRKQRFLVDVGETATELIGWDGVQKGYREVTLEFPENAAPKGKNWPTVYTRQGSMYAVYEFLERWCGVRWANFTRYGTLLPQRPALTVARGSYAGEPFMFYRGGTMDTVWGEDTSPMWFYTPQCSNYVNWCAAAFPGGVKDAGTYDRLWLLRNRAGGELQPACHSFGWLYEKYWDEGSRAFVEKRPQYFAKGYPNRPPQPCFSNPELIKTVVADARAYFDRGGGRWGENAYCLEPEDGSSFCQCADCTRQFEPARSKDSSQHSTYWFRFVNAVAREVKKTHPDKLVTTLAYATHQGVPTGFDVEDNVCIYSCLYHNRERPGNPLYRGEIARMREWHDRQPQVKLAVWLYNCFPLLSGSWGKYNTFPGFFAHEAVRQYRELHELGARGGVFHCGFNGEVANYMQLKLMIDPLRDAEDLLEEHFSIYGKAASAMREFYDLVEERYADESYYPKKGGGGQFLSWGCLGTKDLMDKLADCVKRAEAAAETESEKALVRLFKLDVWDYMCAGYATYQSRAATPLPGWTAKRIAAGAEGDPDRVDWAKASSVTTQFYKSGCAEKVPSEVTVRLAHDGKWLYLELGEKTDVKKLVVAAAVCPCDTWEVLLARQCGVPYRYYIAGPDARGLAYCHGEEGVRNGAPAEELGPKFFGATCRTDRTQKDRWTTRFAFPLDRMTEKPVQPGETVYMNAVRVMNSSLSPSGGMAVYSLVSHSYVHVPDRLGEIVLEK